MTRRRTVDQKIAVTTATEIELKLAVAEAGVAALKRHKVLAAASKPARQRLRAIYFDTPELALRAQRCALRVRRAGRTWVQTFKSGGAASAGLHTRAEAEFTVAGPALDLARLRDVHGAEILRRKRVAGRIIPVFETDFTRTAWTVTAGDGSVVEIALDQGDVWSAGRNAALCELELELMSGDPAALYRIAYALQESALLIPLDASKAERGYRLYCDDDAAPVKAEAVPLTRAMPPDRAMRIVIASCVAQLQANVEGARLGADPEFLHQARVALRRLRAAFALFAPKVTGQSPPYASLRGALRALADKLGQGRDWDVFVDDTLAPVCARFEHDRGLAALLLAARRQRESSARQVRGALEAPAYARLLLELSQAISGAGTEDQNGLVDGRISLRALARAQLARRHRRLIRDSAKIGQGDDMARHRLRIVAKKQRYAAEYFTGLFDASAVARYVKVLSALQDLLGRMNDIVTARVLLDGLAPGAASRVTVDAWLAAKADDALRDLGPACARIAAAARFWKQE